MPSTHPQHFSHKDASSPLALPQDVSDVPETRAAFNFHPEQALGPSGQGVLTLYGLDVCRHLQRKRECKVS